ncbi:MAG TPA: hypothetical protein VF392_11565 [Terracidiphilus sp.]
MAAFAAQAQTPAGHVVLPAGSVLQVELERNAPMKAGATLATRLLYPAYVNNALTVPAGTEIRGKVTAILPDNKTRAQARWNADFTPFHTPQVEFEQLLAAGGTVALHAETTGGAPMIRLSRPGSTPHHGFIARQWTAGIDTLKNSVLFFTAPGRGDRLVQLFYHQLPVHPQRIEAHTAWTLTLTEPLEVTAPTEPATAPPTTPLVEAMLTGDLNSASAHVGDRVEALVIEPYTSADAGMKIPQGARLVGKVTEAKPSGKLGKAGKLRFMFQQVLLPAEPARAVEGSVAGTATPQAHALTMDAEGGVAPRNNASLVAPLILGVLAQRTLDFDSRTPTLHNAVGSNGFGLAGRIAGAASGSHELAAGIGFYAMALSVYGNYLRHGSDVDFAKGTRLEVEMSPARSPVLKPAEN